MKFTTIGKAQQQVRFRRQFRACVECGLRGRGLWLKEIQWDAASTRVSSLRIDCGCGGDRAGGE